MVLWNYNPPSFARMLSLIFYLTVCLHCSVALQFTSEPMNQDVKQGEQANFHCVVDEPEIADISWTLNNVTIVNTGRRYMEEEYLTILEVQRNADAGEFVCVAQNRNTQEIIKSSPATLNIKWLSDNGKVLLKVPSSIEEVVEGIRVTLICRIDGNPSPSQNWYRDGKALSLGSNHEINGARLKIKSMTADDNGEYACRGVNRLGEAWTVQGNITMYIEDTRLAKVSLAPTDVIVVRGDQAKLDCGCSGDPVPSLDWYFKEEGAEAPQEGPLTNDSRRFIFSNGSLTIDQVQKRLNAGIYMCTCSNVRSSDTAEALLTVASIKNMEDFETVYAQIGSPVSINCTFPDNEAGGVPLPLPVWSDTNGIRLTTNGSVKQDGSYLIVNRITTDLFGLYECMMSNIAGEKMASVDIVQSTKPKITNKPTSKVKKEGEDLYMHCQAQGVPAPVIVWLKNSTDVTKMDNRRYEVFPNGTLHIANLKVGDSSSYACKATTPAGSDLSVASITVNVKLKFTHWQALNTKQLEVGETNHLTCSARASSEVTIVWSKEGGSLPGNVHQENNRLIFDIPRKLDSGNYICTAMTSPEDIIRVLINVTVMVQPKFTVLPGNVTGYLGQPLVVECQATGDPKPKITWLDTPKDHSTTHRNGTLIFSKLRQSDEGIYQCIAGSGAGLNTTYLNLSIKRSLPQGGLMTRTIAIAVGCAMSYIFLVVGLMCYCRHRRLKMNRNLEDDEKTNGMLSQNDHREKNGRVIKDGEMTMNPVYPGRRGSYDNLLFPKHDLQKLSVLGKGRFGEVFLARAVGIKDGEEVTTVIVKALNEKDEGIQLEFRREIDMLSKVEHDNVVKLLGICREGDVQFMITEYLDWGDLKNYLIATQGQNGHISSPPPPQLTLTQKIDVINQVALGMEHLASHRFTHGDLAAHNCLLSPSMEIKITTISVSQDLFRNDYHEYHQRLLPIRWMPPEAVFEDDFSTKSDIWSFGVFVWEVFSSGEQPYKDKDNEEVLKAIVDGELMLETPRGTPDEIEILMHRCWSNSPTDRPSFSDIVQTIGELPTDSQI